MKLLLACALALVLCINAVQGSKKDALSTRSSSCLRLMIVSNNCNNHGYCWQGNNGWACRCDNGWGGRDCVKDMRAKRRRLLDERTRAEEGGRGLRQRKEKLREVLKKIIQKQTPKRL